MRIIAGTLKGRTFDSPRGHKTHPMSEKARGAIFNMLGDIAGFTIFDAFAGSGAIAFEAISRGAKSAVATDVTKEAYDAMTENVKKLGIEKKVKVVRANTSGWSDNNPKAIFDIVVVDPPYDDLQTHIVQKLTKHVKYEGLFIVSLPGEELVPKLDGFLQVAHKSYGDMQLVYFRSTLGE